MQSKKLSTPLLHGKMKNTLICLQTFIMYMRLQCLCISPGFYLKRVVIIISLHLWNLRAIRFCLLFYRRLKTENTIADFMWKFVCVFYFAFPLRHFITANKRYSFYFMANVFSDRVRRYLLFWFFWWLVLCYCVCHRYFWRTSFRHGLFDEYCTLCTNVEITRIESRSCTQ